MILKYYYHNDMSKFPCIGIINFASPEVVYRFSNIVLRNKPDFSVLSSKCSNIVLRNKPEFSVLSSNYVFDNKHKSVICFLNAVRLDSDNSTILLGLSNQHISYFKSTYKFLNNQTKIELNDSCLDIIKDNLIQINSDFLKVMNLK